MHKLGELRALFRYPVKSMGGEALEWAELGWHGIEGDRRLACRRIDDRSGFPWLSASRCPEMILFSPLRRGAAVDGAVPTHVRTPGGEELDLFGPELAEELGRRCGQAVEMMYLDRGVFDEASVSLITEATVGEISELAGHRPDVRRFRPNIVISSRESHPFEEDEWVGGVLSFGEDAAAASIAVTKLDERCGMVNLDPDSGQRTPSLLKAVVGERDNKAGVYGEVIRCGRLELGQSLYFTPRA
jgi:hypothetical protein